MTFISEFGTALRRMSDSTNCLDGQPLWNGDQKSGGLKPKQESPRKIRKQRAHDRVAQMLQERREMKDMEGHVSKNIAFCLHFFTSSDFLFSNINRRAMHARISSGAFFTKLG